MQTDWLILDGHNLLHKQPQLLTLLSQSQEKARTALIRLIEPYSDRVASKTTVVFDGQNRGSDIALSTGKIEVLYAPAKLTADGLIEQLVLKADNPHKICIVTSDRLEQQTVLSAGASVQSAEYFLAQCSVKRGAPTYSTKMNPAQKPKLGDIFPDSF
jgi:predicted RNA-binding protein with PIN domain